MATIRQFRASDSEAVRLLFCNGQREFASGYEREIESYIEETLNGDLSDVQSYYLERPGSNFWVAEYAGQVIGTAGLQWRNGEVAELRRMNVARHFRRQGIAQTILDTVEDYARTHGYSRIVLSTITPLAPAIALYKKNGYIRTGADRYGSVTVLHFGKDLFNGDGGPAVAQS